MSRVIVTGASRGLGAAFVEAFSDRGDDVLAVARDEGRLAAEARRLGARCQWLAADLSGAEGCALVVERRPACDVLVLAAGAGLHGEFSSLPLESQWPLISLNVGSVVRLAHHYIGGMRDRREGRILMVASTVAERGAPFLATYAATKAFVLALSRGLGAELGGSGVTVSCLVPGPLATDFAELAGLPARHRSRRGADPRSVAAAGIEGLLRGDAVIVPGVRGRAVRRLKQLLPETLWATLARRHHQPD